MYEMYEYKSVNQNEEVAIALVRVATAVAADG